MMPRQGSSLLAIVVLSFVVAFVNGKQDVVGDNDTRQPDAIKVWSFQWRNGLQKSSRRRWKRNDAAAASVVVASEADDIGGGRLRIPVEIVIPKTASKLSKTFSHQSNLSISISVCRKTRN
jgi:hypothetical protein